MCFFGQNYYKLVPTEDLEEISENFLKIPINPYSENEITIHCNGEIGLLTRKGTIIYRSKVFSSATSFAKNVFGRDITAEERNTLRFKTGGQNVGTWGNFIKLIPVMEGEIRLCAIYKYIKAK